MQKQPLGFFPRAIATLVGGAIVATILAALFVIALGQPLTLPIWGAFFVCLLCVLGPNLAKLIPYYPR